MSTVSGVSSKGEKGKSKFQSLDINSLYHKTAKGESSEQQTAKSTVPRKHGMLCLGKVPSTRRAPVNLPSLKSEHSGSDPTVSLVPTGGTGWGSKPSDATPIPPTTPVTSSGQTPGTNAPAAVGTAPVQPPNITTTPPQAPHPKPVTVANVGDKTWSSVMVGGEGAGGGNSPGIGGTGPSFLAHQSPQFQAEFPSLPGEGGVPGPPAGPSPPGGARGGGEGAYGPGPSLRPQTEGSWAQGTSFASPQQQPPLQQPPIPQPQPSHQSQPSRPVPGFSPQPPPISSPATNIIPQYKGVIPSFMLGRGGNTGFPNTFPTTFQNTAKPPKFQNNQERYNSNMPRAQPAPDAEDLITRPIIREEDLNRMDEISRDSGWATQDDIDYNQKLAFSDEENNCDENVGKGKSTYHGKNIDEKTEKETGKENREYHEHDRPKEKVNQHWGGGRNQPHQAPEFRSPLSRLPHSNTPHDVDMDDVWKEKRRQQSEQVAAAAEKAKQRKEEEEKRFEETRSKSDFDKKKKDDTLYNDQENEESKKEQVESFKQMVHLDHRGPPRGEGQQSFRFIPPRFQKQQQQYNMRHMGSQDARWGNQYYSGGNKQKPRGDNDEKDKEHQDHKDEDSGKRERHTPNTPEPLERRERESDIEWEGRRGNAWEGPRNMDDKQRARDKDMRDNRDPRDSRVNKDSRDFRDHRDSRDNKKSNDGYKHLMFDVSDSDWRDNRERSGHPEPRENRPRESRPSKEETRTVHENAHDYTWGENEYEKEIQDEKHQRKDMFKDDRRDMLSHTRREGHVPGPITREKMEAYEHKHSMAEVFKSEKKELIPSSHDIHADGESEKKKKSDSGGWNEHFEHQDQKTSHQQSSNQGPHGSQMHELGHHKNSNSIMGDDGNDKTHKKDDNRASEKKHGGMPNDRGSMKDNKGLGGRGGGRNQRSGGRQNNYNSSYNIYYRGGGSWSNKDSNRHGTSKLGGKPGNASESDVSGDDLTVSTESGKEDKKTDHRKQGPRSPKIGERKKDKDDRNREGKKLDTVGGKPTDSNNMSRKPLGAKPMGQQGPTSQGQSQHGDHSGSGQNEGGVEGGPGGPPSNQPASQSSSGSGGFDSQRKEGFLPRGEPSRRGRGGFRAPGGRGPVPAHYGPPPGTKPAFSNPPQPPAKEDEANDSSSEEKKRTLTTSGRKEQGGRKSDSDSSRSNKGKGGKPTVDQEDGDSTSEGSDNDKNKSKQNKKPMHKHGGEKRSNFNSNHINGVPRPEDSKHGGVGKTRFNKEDDESNKFTNHSDVFHSNNGFQEVRTKKTGKDARPLSGVKDDIKRGGMRGGVPGKDKGKGLGDRGQNKERREGGGGGKPGFREWVNRPPRMQRLQQQQQQQHQRPGQEQLLQTQLHQQPPQQGQQPTGQQSSQPQQLPPSSVAEINKINKNLSMFRDVSCPAPPPPPSVNAWDKPITAALRTTSPPTSHLTSSIPSTLDKNVIELNDHGPSGPSSQTSSPCTEKALSKIGREGVEKSVFDGNTPPTQTVVFENTNYKTPNEIALKSKYPLNKGQRIEKGRDSKLSEELDDSSSHVGLGFKAGADIKPGESKSQEPIQMPMPFSKNEDSADMKLDFPFDSDLSHLTDEKNNIPRSIHQVLGQNSTADLNQKIASVKKVWETPGSMIEHQHHDDSVSTSSSFTPNFSSTVDSSLDPSHPITPDDPSFASDVYTTPNPTSNRANYFILTGPQIPGSSQGYASSSGTLIKPDPSSANSNVKPQPQQTVMSSALGTHTGQSLSSPPPPFNQQGPYGYQAPYSNIPAIPSPPAVLINSAAAAAGAQQVPPSHQAEPQLYHSFQIGAPPVINSQQARSGFSQYPYGLGQGLGTTSAFGPGNLYQLPQPTPTPNPDVFQSLSQFRIQQSAAAYGQSQQLNNSPSTVLITSSSNSLMSASVKNSPQPPPLGAIGSKAGFQSSAHPSPQVQLGFIQYEAPQLLQQSFLQNSQIVQRHGGNNVVPAIQPQTSYYSNSGGQTGLFQPGSSLLAGSSQAGTLHSASFGMQGFGSQSATTPAQPNSLPPVGVQSYSSQMGHFRGQTPSGSSTAAPYLKTNSSSSGQHGADPSKSPSTNQDLVNSILNSGAGGGQIPSPKSRAAGNPGGPGGKQPQPPQQPSPTQASHHKFSSYQTQSNLVMQGGGAGQNGSTGSGQHGGAQMPQGVRGSDVGNGGLGGSGGVRYPNPIQRPVGYQGMQQHQQQRNRIQAQQSRTQPAPGPSPHQQHMKIPGQYYHQGNPVKLDVKVKDGDKLQESTNSTDKVEKKEERASTADQ